MSAESQREAESRPRLPDEQLEWIRASRRNPSPTQPDFLILRRLLQHLAASLGKLEGPLDVLDVFCGTRPYEHLLPAGSNVTGLDVDDRYGSADVTSTEFLPFADSSFDLVLFTEGFFYLPDPAAAAAELKRVLRPGGRLVLTLPLIWEYNRDQLEHRFTGPELAAVFAEWSDVEVEEVGGFAVSWATIGGRILRAGEEMFTHRGGILRLIRPLFVPLYLALNAVAVAADRFERRIWRPAPYQLPDHLLLTARREQG